MAPISQLPASPLVDPSQPARYEYVIGVDFGTAFASVNFAFIKESTETIDYSESHPVEMALNGRDRSISTTCAYDLSDPPQLIVGEARIQQLIGDQVISEEDVFRWLKAGLCETDDPDLVSARKEQVENPLERLKDKSYAHRNYTINDVLADFMQYLAERTDFELENKHYRGSDDDSWKMQLVLGHPSIWSIIEINNLRKAAQDGFLKVERFRSKHELGLLEISLCHESIASFANLMGRDRKDIEFQPGDSLNIIDCGGATCESLIATVSSRFELTQEVPGDCCYAGGATVNQNFRKRLENALIANNIELDNTSYSELLQSAVYGFENSKKEFDGNNSSSCIVACIGVAQRDDPGLEVRGYTFRNHSIKISGSEMAAIFQPSIQKIADMVKAQHRECRRLKRAIPERLVLTGCYGLNRYLLGRLKRLLPENRIIQGKANMELIVSEGCVQARRNSKLIRNRMPLISYGFCSSIVYHEEIHGKQPLEDYFSRFKTRKIPKTYTGILPSDDDPEVPVFKNIFEIFPRRGEHLPDPKRWVIPSEKHFYVEPGNEELYCDEALYMSRKTHTNWKSISDEANEIHQVANLEIRIPNPQKPDGFPENPYNFDLLAAPRKRRKLTRPIESWVIFRVDLFLVLLHSNGVLAYQYVIPKDGKLPGGDRKYDDIIDNDDSIAFRSKTLDFSIAKEIPHSDDADLVLLD